MRTRRSIYRGLCMGVVRVFPVRIPVPVLVLWVQSAQWEGIPKIRGLNRPLRALAVFLLMALLPVLVIRDWILLSALPPAQTLLALEQIRIPALLYLVLMPVLVIRVRRLSLLNRPLRVLPVFLLMVWLLAQAPLALAQFLISVMQVVVVFVYMGVPRGAWFRSSLSDILKFPRNNVQTSLMFKNLQLQVA